MGMGDLGTRRLAALSVCLLPPGLGRPRRVGAAQVRSLRAEAAEGAEGAREPRGLRWPREPRGPAGGPAKRWPFPTVPPGRRELEPASWCEQLGAHSVDAVAGRLAPEHRPAQRARRERLAGHVVRVQRRVAWRADVCMGHAVAARAWCIHGTRVVSWREHLAVADAANELGIRRAHLGPAPRLLCKHRSVDDFRRPRVDFRLGHAGKLVVEARAVRAGVDAVHRDHDRFDRRRRKRARASVGAQVVPEFRHEANLVAAEGAGLPELAGLGLLLDTAPQPQQRRARSGRRRRGEARQEDHGSQHVATSRRFRRFGRFLN